MSFCSVNMLCFLISVIFVLIHSSLSQDIGQQCRLNSGGTGVCYSTDDCDLDLLTNEGNRPAVCGWNDDGAVVCCPQQGGAPQSPPRPQTPTISISQQKCEEYSRIKCDSGKARHTIVNGTVVTSVEEFPHMALIGYQNFDNPVPGCGGALISEQWVLTAAHCLDSRGLSNPVAVDIGFLKKSNKNEFGTYQRFRVVEQVKPPKRNGSLKYHDIALLKLDRPARLSTSILPACLHNTENFKRTKGLATGWGDLQYGSNAGTDELMKVALNLLDHNTCQSNYSPNRRIPNGIISGMQFCAGGESVDTCQGDSGGPLQIIHDNLCMQSIIGVTSFGDHCAIKPGVYTRVSAYIPWIESIVWPNN